MKSEEFTARFQRMVNELETHPHIEIVDFHLYRPASQEEIDGAKRSTGGRLPNGVEAFYQEMNGFSLEWEITLKELGQDNDYNKGLIDILPLAEMLKGWQGAIWFEGDERYKPVKPLDFFVPEACSALLYREGSGFAPMVHYHYLGEFLLDTGYDFLSYIERLLASRGSWYWIETLCRETCGSPASQAFLRRMPRLFPDFDPTLFQPGAGGGDR